MKKILLFCFCAGNISLSQAQQFISKAVIEFEVKTNIKKTMGNDSWDELMKSQLPDFKTGYYNYIFSNGKSIYKFDHWAEQKIPSFLRNEDEKNQYYFDHANNKFFMQKSVYGTSFSIEDTIPAIHWKLSNESRVIAGFNCRKAVGIIMDSVYVFAFYTDEIMIPGGPVSISGLPGMVLGLTIPRMYTSYIATRVSLSGVNDAVIVPVASKKYYTQSSFRSALLERSKDWESSDDPESRKWIDQFRWNAFL